MIRNIEVIGEAAKRVSVGARIHLGSLDWKAVCGMRDVLIHDYIGVDLDEVWNVAVSRIPELQTVLGQFLADEDAGSAHHVAAGHVFPFSFMWQFLWQSPR